MTLFIHSLFLIAQFVTEEITSQLRHNSCVLQNKKFSHPGLYLQERCSCTAKVWVIGSRCRHFSLRVASSVSCCRSIWENLSLVRVWVESVTIISSASSFSLHLYTTCSIYKASSGPYHQRKPQIGSATEMCNLVVLCILNATVLRVFPYSLCIIPSFPCSNWWCCPLLLFLPQDLKLGKVSFLLSSFWHGHRSVPTLTAWRLCLPL